MNTEKFIEKMLGKGVEETTKEELIQLVQDLKREKKYGLVWEDQVEEVEEYLRHNYPVLKEVKEREIHTDSDKPTNLLIEGDNLHALHSLQFTHKSSVDVIYIDPPYNTGGKDFIYNDKIVDSDDVWRHSKWLSFMNNRLKLAKELLSDKGVIFISIGDDEQAQLKLLCDQIFGESNFISQISRVTKRGGSKGTNINPNVDYVLIYSKNLKAMEPFNKLVDEDYLSRYKSEDKKGRYILDGFFRPSMQIRPNQRYYIECPDGSFIIPKGKTFPDVVEDGSFVTPTKGDGVWRWSYNRYLTSKEDVVLKKNKKPNPNLIDENGNPSHWGVYKKVYLDLEKSGVLQEQSQSKFLNTEGTEKLKELQISFDFSKPVSLISWCLSLTPNKNATVLDFFAGSGTTGQAVLELNKEDGGNRQFILVTNNENNIAEEVTYERLKRVIHGYTTPKGKEVEGLGGNLKYYQTKFVSKEQFSDDVKIQLALESKELLCIKENCFNVVNETPSYSIYQSPDKLMGIYTDFLDYDFDELQEIYQNQPKSEKILYVLIFDDGGILPEEAQPFIDMGVDVKPIPKKVRELFNHALRNQERGAIE